ncbi:alkyl/aryl-sulfatase [Legionella fallonii]|uniref:Linear primary-alkylsulfatase n=1 Tax=Legionella fallonii LLAP-10 TaxID=1212491 RepID=A0A098G3J8_9GAMM|nr:alkyl sulfatase dimerization domain-containing protein [Legionella fallonii]CEG56060.1 Alkyl/aryl-sulfatase BDS1 [Legionella fallonii LLAP-10]
MTNPYQRIALYSSLIASSISFAADNLGGFKEPTELTQQKNAAMAQSLPFAAQQDFADATRGFIATNEGQVIKKTNEDRVIWDLNSYQFIKGEKPPASINPSLWRQARLNMNNGLYKVTDRIYQIRGFDLSNMDIIEGNTGLIIVDPLISAETAKAGLDLYFKHRPKKSVVAVIYTHSHVDHYGGVKGIVNEDDVTKGKVKIYAPKGFLEEAVSENVYAGNAMSRRSFYMYGTFLPRGERGQVDAGLGKTTSTGTVTLIPPTDEIKQTGEIKNIDGIDIVFQMAPHTEAPAEMLMYFPQFKALCAAEDATHTLHNLYTLRGAQVRDAASWWKTLNETIELFGDKTEVVFAQHHWPMWDNKRVVEFLESQRDLYKFIHDQALRMLNQGFVMTEIGNMMQLPPELANKWYNRDYYGSVSHDAKAVYQRYLGWYDSNPAHLDPIMPVESSKKYVEYMGGADAVIEKATEAYNKGEYRWVAEVMNHVVFADPNNKKARDLEADAFEQLGYQTENPTWRNEYLMGAFELRNGVPKILSSFSSSSSDTIRAMPMEMYLDYLGMRLDGQKAQGKKMSINLSLTDKNQQYAIKLQNSVLIYTANKKLDNADVSVSLPRNVLDAINLRETTLDDELKKGTVKIDGDRNKLSELLDMLVVFQPTFNIITPNEQ